MKKSLNKITNHENLDSSRFFFYRKLHLFCFLNAPYCVNKGIKVLA